MVGGKSRSSRRRLGSGCAEVIRAEGFKSKQKVGNTCLKFEGKNGKDI